ncbi:MAG: hypothetical protein U0805_21730 [Pirellulales bacterium]
MRGTIFRVFTVILLSVFATTACGQALEFTADRVSHADTSAATFAPAGETAVLNYDLKDGGWANISTPLRHPTDTRPITFLFKSTKPCTLELKFLDAAGATFGQRVSIEASTEFHRLTIYPRDAEYWWGGDRKRDALKSFDIAVAGVTGKGELTVKAAMFGKAGDPSSFGPPPFPGTERTDSARTSGAAGDAPLVQVPYHGPLLDPDREFAGIGVRQRRAEKLTAEDPLVLEWLKQMQDSSTPDHKLITSTAGGDEVHTFNNVLAAMAFVRDGERERAERILDFFRDAATDRNNADPTKQSFFLRGEARGFYQRVSLHGGDGVAPMHAPANVDRWMGDMAWLTFACLDHDRAFKDTRYAGLTKLLTDLLRNWWKPNPNGPGGYVQHGWRKGDTKLHEESGHHEGNVDCYAVFMLLGDRKLARQISVWLNSELIDRNDLPLDLYTWRVMAFNGQPADLLNIPDYDLRFRKIVRFHERTVIGPYSGPADVDNIWVEGIGHMACAFAAAGHKQRAFFYANQLDNAIIEQHVAGTVTHSLPYTLNRSGDYAWVNPDEGFLSAAAWYILAKHQFNPLRLTAAPTE